MWKFQVIGYKQTTPSKNTLVFKRLGATGTYSKVLKLLPVENVFKQWLSTLEIAELIYLSQELVLQLHF